MEQQIHTSTPIISDKSNSSSLQKHHKTWFMYRNSNKQKQPSWSELNAPCFVHFQNIYTTGDLYFDRTGVYMLETPQRNLNKPLPGFEENNNILEKCPLSAIKKHKPDKQEDEKTDSRPLKGTGKLTPHVTETPNSCCPSTIKSNEVEKLETESPMTRASNDNSNEQPVLDGVDKEVRGGFGTNPAPSIVKCRKNSRPQAQGEKLSEIEKLRLQNAAESWKKKAFQPSLPKKVTPTPKAPVLLTAVRAKERQRYEEQRREKERRRQALHEMEESAKKKREEEAIANLRKELVHKTQPILKSKTKVVPIEKRPPAKAPSRHH